MQARRPVLDPLCRLSLLLGPGVVLGLAAHSALAGPGRVEHVQDPCPTLEAFPDEWVGRTATAHGRQSEAIEAAFAKAELELLEQLCSGVDALRCAGIRRHVHPWGQGEWRPASGGPLSRKGTACAAAVAPARYLEQFDQEHQAFAKDLARIGHAVRGDLGDDRLYVAPPAWAGSGCAVGPLGQAIQGELISHLHQVERVRRPDPRAWTLTLDLYPGPSRAPGTAERAVKLVASLAPPAGDTQAVLGDTTFSPDLFGIEPDERGDCRGVDELGLAPTAGQGGLTIRIDPPTQSGAVCEGRTSDPLVLRTNQPARVRLYSLAAEGSGWLIWQGSVDGEREFATIDALHLQDLGDERWVAVALPPGESWTRGADWSPNCRLPEPLGRSHVPRGAALDTTTYTVQPAGSYGCPPWSEEYSRADLAGALFRLPECGK